MAASDPTRLARDALERVCSGSDPSAAVGVYSADFRDHVNARAYHGHEDSAASDGLDVIRQLGPWRTLLLGIASLRSGRAQKR